MALRSPMCGWPVWQLPRWLAACVTAVIAAYAAAAAGALASAPMRPGDLRLCAVFVGCGAASVELTRRAGEREGLVQDVYAIWDLPTAVLLPPLYALVIPLPRAVFTEWRIRRTLLHRRAYSTAAEGLSCAAASVVFRSAMPALAGPGGCCRPRCLHMVRQQSLLMKRQRSVSLYPRPAAPGAGTFP